MGIIVQTGKADSDYLKYYRIIFKFICVKHGFNREEMEAILFLRHEKIFDRKKFYELAMTVSLNRFIIKHCLNRGIIHNIDKGSKGIAQRYTLTKKAINAANHLYNLIEGKEELAMSQSKNPLTKKSGPFINRVYMNAIREMKKALTDDFKSTHQNFVKSEKNSKGRKKKATEPQ